MRRLIIEVADREAAGRRFLRAMGGERQGEFLTFPSLELLHRILTPARVRILEALQRLGPVGVRALARELGVDPGNLARQIKPLRELGLVEEGEGGLVVPYDEIRMELVIRKVA